MVTRNDVLCTSRYVLFLNSEYEPGKKVSCNPKTKKLASRINVGTNKTRMLFHVRKHRNNCALKHANPDDEVTAKHNAIPSRPGMCLTK